jgi:hypothetical protein
VMLPAVVGLGFLGFGSHVLLANGYSFFLGIPFTVGVLSGFLIRFRRPGIRFAAGAGTASLAAAVSITGVAAGAMGLGFDGLICIIMASPLALACAIPGASVGYALAQLFEGAPSSSAGLLLVLGLPGVMGFEAGLRRDLPVREVTTSVVIDAPIETVWRNVIEFDRIDEKPRGVFRFGVAYPISARIEGEGVGAVRHCVFSTGAFVEPITAWDEPTLLAFDVVENPAPMKEWSIYADLEPPHLHGTFVSERGQFRLTAGGEGTVLEGTTWYTQSLAPSFYWGRVSDAIIHRIHLRVLEHIKTAAEGERGA